MQKFSKFLYLFITTFFFIIFNQYLSGNLISENIEISENPVASIVFVQNQGAAFNLFEGSKIFLISFAIFAIGIILFYVIKEITKISTVGLFFVSMLIAGIFSNMYERLIYGFVRDFISLNFIDFPVFNISDIFINISVLAIIIIIIIKNNYSSKNNENNN